MQLVMGLALLSLAADMHAQQDRDTPVCGGRLTAPVGTIHTPNFPNPFPVPIKCKWIIEHSIQNGTISVYFTQQYTTSGLTFTEYTYYDQFYKLEERRALTVTDENITRIKWLQVQSPVLVVELNLNRLEGSQLRALGLLSVYGFNITYAVRAPTDPPGPTSCSAIECRLLGHCYAKHDYKEFYCSCFDGYSGVDCGVGPLCPKTSNMCKNGGTCRQMGPAAVSCICAPGYTGDLCESQLHPPECGIPECSVGCKKGKPCDCNPKDTDASSAHFDTKLQVVEQTNVNMSQEITKQLTSYLKTSNITLEEDIEILNMSSVEALGARSVWVRVWCARREAGALRAALARLAATRARSVALRLLPATIDISMQPALNLNSLAVNQRPEVWEGSEFILTCMAYGSPNIAFTWYKDGIEINFNGTTRDIWTRTVSEYALGRRMSVLGVAEAVKLDSGKWACAADDAGRRRCRALSLTVLTPPEVRLLPSTLTVHKGDNVSITCLAGAGRVHGALGFSWARERTLLPLSPGREVWEDLYPAGSVLKLYNIQKSNEFRCQVSSVGGTNAKAVTLWALGTNDEACESETSHGIRWPKTAPGAHAAAPCPPGHSGEATRFCEPKIGQHGVKWMSPDFSGCIADSLNEIYEQFRVITLGYSWGNLSLVCGQYWGAVRTACALPGEGVPALRHATHMLQYLLSAAARSQDVKSSATQLLRIYDELLSRPDAFLDEEKVFELQNAVTQTAGLRRKSEERFGEFSVKTGPAGEHLGAHLDLSHTALITDEWVVTSIAVQLPITVGNATVLSVLYHNLGARLPSLRKFMEIKAGVSLQYAVYSRQVQVYVTGNSVQSNQRYTVTLLFNNIRNYSVDASTFACGVRTASEPGTWNTDACELWIPSQARMACRCRSLGTIALLTMHTAEQTDAESELRGVARVTVSVCGAMCLVAAMLQLLAVRSSNKLPALLRAITAVTHAAALLALPHCHTTQSTPCMGTWSWVVASCWCAGTAALCAQPLHTHAELSGAQSHASSVGLLAGVCTLSLLTARVWGGSPLQVGSAAFSVCSGSVALLSALAFALSLCAGRTLRSISHKLPAERRGYCRKLSRAVKHTLVLLLTTTACQAASVVYVQAGERHVPHVVALCATALTDGVAILVCYVIYDEECLLAMRHILSPSSNRNWQESPAGDVSHSLYIKQGGEMESLGGVVALESSSPVTRYWRAAPLRTPVRHLRAECLGDSRADIVQCVEHNNKQSLCDLIPAPSKYVTTVCLELGVMHSPIPATDPPAPLLTCSVDFEPYSDTRSDTAKESCTICAQSNPDVSKLPSPPIKSCLKRSKSALSCDTSLPSIDITTNRDNEPSHIQQVNREWNKAYNNTDKVLNKITNDLDFLLNRNSDSKQNIDHATEAPS